MQCEVWESADGDSESSMMTHWGQWQAQEKWTWQQQAFRADNQIASYGVRSFSLKPPLLLTEKPWLFLIHLARLKPFKAQNFHVAQRVECVASNTKDMGLVPRECMNWYKKYAFNAMQVALDQSIYQMHKCKTT